VVDSLPAVAVNAHGFIPTEPIYDIPAVPVCTDRNSSIAHPANRSVQKPVFTSVRK